MGQGFTFIATSKRSTWDEKSPTSVYFPAQTAPFVFATLHEMKQAGHGLSEVGQKEPELPGGSTVFPDDAVQGWMGPTVEDPLSQHLLKL